MSGMLDSVAGMTAMFGIGACVLCIRSMLELRENSSKVFLTSREFLISIATGAVAGCLVATATTAAMCGLPGDAQCGFPLRLSLPTGIATGEILGLAALVRWRIRRGGTDHDSRRGGFVPGDSGSTDYSHGGYTGGAGRGHTRSRGDDHGRASDIGGSDDGGDGD